MSGLFEILGVADGVLARDPGADDEGWEALVLITVWRGVGIDQVGALIPEVGATMITCDADPAPCASERLSVGELSWTVDGEISFAGNSSLGSVSIDWVPEDASLPSMSAFMFCSHSWAGSGHGMSYRSDGISPGPSGEGGTHANMVAIGTVGSRTLVNSSCAATLLDAAVRVGQNYQ